MCLRVSRRFRTRVRDQVSTFPIIPIIEQLVAPKGGVTVELISEDKNYFCNLAASQLPASAGNIVHLLNKRKDTVKGKIFTSQLQN